MSASTTAAAGAEPPSSAGFERSAESFSADTGSDDESGSCAICTAGIGDSSVTGTGDALEEAESGAAADGTF